MTGKILNKKTLFISSQSMKVLCWVLGVDHSQIPEEEQAITLPYGPVDVHKGRCDTLGQSCLFSIHDFPKLFAYSECNKPTGI